MKKLITILVVILLASCSSGPSIYEGDRIININTDSIETVYTARLITFILTPIISFVHLEVYIT